MREKYGRYPLRWTGEKAKYQFPHLHPALKPARMGESPELESARNRNRPTKGNDPNGALLPFGSFNDVSHTGKVVATHQFTRADIRSLLQTEVSSTETPLICYTLERSMQR